MPTVKTFFIIAFWRGDFAWIEAFHIPDPVFSNVTYAFGAVFTLTLRAAPFAEHPLGGPEG